MCQWSHQRKDPICGTTSFPKDSGKENVSSVASRTIGGGTKNSKRIIISNKGRRNYSLECRRRERNNQGRNIGYVCILQCS
jgi:hypothetical protein